MRGNAFTEFMDDLLVKGGPEKEVMFRGKRYFMEAQLYEKDISQTEFVIFECFGDQNYIFRCHGKTMRNVLSNLKKQEFLMDRSFTKQNRKWKSYLDNALILSRGVQ